MLAIIKDTSIYTFGNVLTKGISFFAIIFYTHFLSQDQIGVYGYIAVIIGFVNTFLILGMDNAYARYFFEHKSTKEKKILTTTLFVFLTFWISIALVLPLIYVDEISFKLLETNNYNTAFFLALLSLPLKLLSAMSNQALRNQFLTKQYVIFNFITAFITVFSAILFLKFTGLGIASIFLGMIIADAMILPFRLFVIKDLFILQIDFTILKKILAYGIPFLPASIAYWVFSSADRVMLEAMSNLKSVGAYTVAASLGAVMSIFASAIGQAWSPHAVKVYEENKEEAKILYARFFNVLMIFALLIIFCAAMIGKEVIAFIFPIEYSNVFLPMLLLLTAIGFQITTQVTAIGIGLAKKTIYLVYITLIVAIVNIGLNYILIPQYSEIGASFATMISYLLLTVLYALVSKKLFHIEYKIKYILLAVLTLIISLIATTLPLCIRFSIFGLLLYSLYFFRNKILKGIR